MDKKKIKIIIIAAAAALAVTVGVLALIFLQKKTVPDVVGKNFAQAVEILSESGIRAQKTGVYSDTVPKDTVMSQSVEPQKQIRKITPLKLTVSLGIEPIEVPDLINLGLSDAEAALTKRNFKYKVEESYHSKVAKGKIIKQSVPAYRKIDKGSEITITVSLGKEMVTLPNTIGTPLIKAIDNLNKIGITVLQVDYKCSDNIKTECVVSQSVKGGELIEKGSDISLTVSLGKANTVGNTNGNLLNRGIVAKQGDWIYYVNTNEDYYIWKMLNDGSQKTLVCADMHVGGGLNVVGEWVYYVNASTDSIYKVRFDGTQNTLVCNANTQSIYVIGDWIYFIDGWTGGNLYKIRTDGTGKTQIGTDIGKDMSIEGNKIYYTNLPDGAVHCINTDGTGKTKLTDRQFGTNLTLCGDYLVAAHNYSFWITKTSGKISFTPRTITYKNAKGETVTSWVRTADFSGNMYYSDGEQNQKGFLCSNGEWIYYLENDFLKHTNTFYRINPKTLERQQIKKVNFLNHPNYFICVADGWLYFPNEDYNDRLCRINIETGAMQKVYEY